MRKTFAVLILLLLALCNFCFAANVKAEKPDDIRVKAEVDKAFLTIGDLVTYTVTIEHAPDIQILSNIPAPESDILEIKKVEDIQKSEKNKIITGRKFVLTTFRLGEFILDPVTVRYQKTGQPEKSIQTNNLYLTVKSVAENEPKEDIRDVKSVVPIHFRYGKLIILILVLFALFVAYGIYRNFRKTHGGLNPEISPLTPEEEALQRLTELFESDLLKRDLAKIYFLRLSEILRIYFEKRYKILAVESTTNEILRTLRPLHLDSNLFQKIQYVLEAADLAKFAKWVPPAPDVTKINENSEEIVKESAPAPVQPASEASHGV